MKHLSFVSLFFTPLFFLQANLIEHFSREGLDLTIPQTEAEVFSIKKMCRTNGVVAAFPSAFVGGILGFLQKNSSERIFGGGLLGAVIGYLATERIYWFLNKKRALMNERLSQLLHQARARDKNILALVDQSRDLKTFIENASTHYATSECPLSYVSDELTAIIFYIDSVHTLFVEILETHKALDHATEARIKAYCEKIDGTMPYIRKILSGLKGSKELKKEITFKHETALKEAKIEQIKQETAAAQARAQADVQQARVNAELVQAHRAQTKQTQVETTKTWLQILFGAPRVKVDVTHR